jgi:DNA-binding transcriptional LysR family regulator
MSTMELRQLERFLVVAEHLSFTRAANRLHIVQSALTTSIQDLERELGAKLFMRNKHHVEGLTEAGKAFQVEARRALAAVGAAQQAVTAVEGLLRGTLTLGILPRFVSKVDLPSMLGRFRIAHPGVQIRLVGGSSLMLMNRVHDGRLDLAVLGQVERPPLGVTTTLLERESLFVALPPNHPLARRKEIPLLALSEENFVDFQPGMGLRTLADRAFGAAGIHRKPTCEVNSLHSLLDLVANGLGIALVPQAATSYPGEVCYVRARPPVPTWDVVVAHLGTQPVNPAARVFLKVLTDHSARTSGKMSHD